MRTHHVEDQRHIQSVDNLSFTSQKNPERSQSLFHVAHVPCYWQLMRNWLRLLCLCLFAGPVLSGCSNLSYYLQSADGHLELLAARQSVDKIADDPKQPEKLRTEMMLARDIRQFATDELALPDNKSYKSYVDVGRDYVTVAVFAAPEFSFMPKVWCFPVFGCVPYRAHFSLDAARSERDELQAQGYDVHLSGVTAYSTLGWSSDPLLNTMFREDETHLAGVVFHELAHQKLYFRDDSAFNEAFAVAVERTGVEKLLRAQGKSDALRSYDADDQQMADFLSLIDKTRSDLNAIYNSNSSGGQKRASKAHAFDRLRADYQRMRDTRWGGNDGYDGWFEGSINNAKIAATAVYSDLVPDFLRLFQICGADYPRFYKAAALLGSIERTKRAKALSELEYCE